MDDYYAEYDEILLDADARSTAFFSVDEAEEITEHRWHVEQIFSDPEGDHDFRISADLDIDATQDGGEAVFANYAVGFASAL